MYLSQEEALADTIINCLSVDLSKNPKINNILYHFQALLVVIPNWLNPFSRKTWLAKWWLILSNCSAASRWKAWKSCRVPSYNRFVQGPFQLVVDVAMSPLPLVPVIAFLTIQIDTSSILQTCIQNFCYCL